MRHLSIVPPYVEPDPTKHECSKCFTQWLDFEPSKQGETCTKCKPKRRKSGKPSGCAVKSTKKST